MSNKVKANGGINLAQGIPGFQPPKELIEHLIKVAPTKIHQYAAGNGNNDLLDLLLKKYTPEYPFTKDDFLVLQGGTEALSLLYTYFNKTIKEPFSALAFNPVYESYKYLPGIFNSNFIAYSYQKDSTIDFENLQDVCIKQNVKVIFVSSPGNPYGRIWTKSEIDTLIELSNKYNIYIVLDAVYRELYFEQKPYIPLDQFNPNLFYTNSFSKILSITGWRIGYLIAHKKHMAQIKSIHDYTGLCASSVLQQALVNYLVNHDYGKTYISDLRNRLKESYFHLAKELSSVGFEIPETKGGYFVWAKLPSTHTDGFKFAIDLYDEQKVAVIPGEHFSDEASSYIRFNIARDKKEVEEGITRIKNFFRG